MPVPRQVPEFSPWWVPRAPRCLRSLKRLERSDLSAWSPFSTFPARDTGLVLRFEDTGEGRGPHQSVGVPESQAGPHLVCAPPSVHLGPKLPFWFFKDGEGLSLPQGPPCPACNPPCPLCLQPPTRLSPLSQTFPREVWSPPLCLAGSWLWPFLPALSPGLRGPCGSCLRHVLPLQGPLPAFRTHRVQRRLIFRFRN